MVGEDTQPNRHIVEEGNTEAIVALAIRIRALEKSQSYGNTQVEELRKDVAIASRTLVRVEQQFAKYEQHLIESMESQKFWASVRDEVIRGVAKSAVWAVIVGFCVALAYAVKAYAMELMNGKI